MANSRKRISIKYLCPEDPRPLRVRGDWGILRNLIGRERLDWADPDLAADINHWMSKNYITIVRAES